jgi:Leucine-rich repeat (LRR) protein
MILSYHFPRSDLASNRLTSVSSPALFSNLVNLKAVALSFNNITSFDALPSLPLLTSLVLRNNQLTALTAGQFTGASGLMGLYVSSLVEFILAL